MHEGRREVITKVAISCNVIALLVYSISLDQFHEALPDVTFATIANAFLILLSLPFVKGGRRLFWLLSLVTLVLISCLSNIGKVNPVLEIQVIRGVFVIFSLWILVERFSLEGFLEKSFIVVSLIGAVLAYLQMISGVLYGDPTFGIGYESGLVFNPSSPLSFRVSPLNGDPNYFAFVLLPGLVILACRFLESTRMLFLIGLIFISGGLFLTYSRGALLAAAFAYLAIIVSRTSGGEVKAVTKSASVVTLSVVILFFIPALKERRSGNLGSSSNQRLDIIFQQFDLISEGLIFGKSFSGSKVLVDGQYFGAHNLFLEMVASYGFLYPIIFMFPVVWFLIKRKKFLDMQAISLTSAFLVSSLFLGLMVYHSMWLFYALLLSNIGRKSREFRG